MCNVFCYRNSLGSHVWWKSAQLNGATAGGCDPGSFQVVVTNFSQISLSSAPMMLLSQSLDRFPLRRPFSPLSSGRPVSLLLYISPLEKRTEQEYSPCLLRKSILPRCSIYYRLLRFQTSDLHTVSLPHNHTPHVCHKTVLSIIKSVIRSHRYRSFPLDQTSRSHMGSFHVSPQVSCHPKTFELMPGIGSCSSHLSFVSEKRGEPTFLKVSQLQAGASFLWKQPLNSWGNQNRADPLQSWT